VVYDLISSLPEDRYDITLATYPGGELIQWIKDLETQGGEACTDYRYSSAQAGNIPIL